MKLTPEQRCAANIEAWAAHHGFVMPKPRKTEQDRCWYARTGDLLDFIARMILTGKLHKANYRNHGKTAEAGYREDIGRCAVQVVLHREFVEIDFDHWNPRDVVGFLGHLAEVAVNKFTKRKTDPFAIASELRKRGVIHAV